MLHPVSDAGAHAHTDHADQLGLHGLIFAGVDPGNKAAVAVADSDGRRWAMTRGETGALAFTAAARQKRGAWMHEAAFPGGPTVEALQSALADHPHVGPRLGAVLESTVAALSVVAPLFRHQSRRCELTLQLKVWSAPSPHLKRPYHITITQRCMHIVCVCMYMGRHIDGRGTVVCGTLGQCYLRKRGALAEALRRLHAAPVSSQTPKGQRHAYEVNGVAHQPSHCRPVVAGWGNAKFGSTPGNPTANARGIRTAADRDPRAAVLPTGERGTSGVCGRAAHPRCTPAAA